VASLVIEFDDQGKGDRQSIKKYDSDNVQPTPTMNIPKKSENV
jgi:hypothetical protein